MGDFFGRPFWLPPPTRGMIIRVRVLAQYRVVEAGAALFDILGVAGQLAVGGAGYVMGTAVRVTFMAADA